jgi:NLI interacting factor-like phosphatase
VIRTLCRLYDPYFALLFGQLADIFIYRLTLTTDRKVQTIKDLEKPWAALKPQHPRSSSSTLAPFAVTTKHQSSSSKSPGHSAATTILLDDSHAKAALQPYNHLCVPEYSRAQRTTDIAVLQQLQHLEQHSTSPRQEDASAPAAPTADADAHAAPSPDAPTGNVRKRKRKKAQAQAQPQQPTTPVLPTAADGSPATLDETLLAVIGILHAARLQSSIAGWLRAGALFLPPSKRGGGDGNEGGSDGAKVWFDDPVLVREWASRGREAMQELQLKVEHGVEP